MNLNIYAKQKAIGFNVGRDMRWDIFPSVIINVESAPLDLAVEMRREEKILKTYNKMNQLQMSSKTSRGSCFQKS